MPQDFQLTFPPGTTRECTLIPIIDDSVPEDNEFFTIRVSIPGGPTITTTVTIIDDDGIDTQITYKVVVIYCIVFDAEECPQLSDIPFGSVSQTGRQVGDTATYTCNTGYELVGPPVRTCTQINPDTADFDGDEPVCRRKLRVSSYL